MHTYISLLRGINVAGQKSIKSKDLQMLYTNCGFENVTTYIQSGNVIFQTEEAETSALETLIENAILTHYQFEVNVFVYAQNTYQNLINAIPESFSHPEQVYLTFLSDTPKDTLMETINTQKKPEEQFYLAYPVLYACFPEGYGNTKISNTFIEKKGGIQATTRNDRTAKHLLALTQTK